MNSLSSFKYFKMLKTLSEEELKQFDLWLCSPWCNSNKNLVKLLDKVKKYHPEYEHPKLTKEKLFKQILPNGKFSDRRMNNLLSEGFLAAEQFIIFQNLKNNENLKKDLLTIELQNRYLDDWFFKDVNKEINRLEEKEIKDWEDHLDLYRLNRRVYNHANPNSLKNQGGEAIVKMTEHLDLVYSIEKAAIINEKIFRNRILRNDNHEINKDLNNWQVISKNVKDTSIDFFKLRFEYTDENMLKKYFHLRDKFFKNFEKLNQKEQNTHLISLLNDSIKLVRARHFDITEALPLYKLGLKTEILMDNGILSYSRFVAVVAASNLKKDFDFTNELIEMYSKKLKSNIYLDSLFWAKAHTEYNKRNLNKCLDFLLSHSFTISYFQRITKILTTQVYFDLFLKDSSYETYLFNYFDSFEKWTHREKFPSDYLKKSILKFIQKIRTIAKSYSDVNFHPDKIKNLLLNETNVQAPKWLSIKIEEVIKLKNKGHSNVE